MLAVLLKFNFLACPFCGSLGQMIVIDKKQGMDCRACGNIYSKGYFKLNFYKSKMLGRELKNLRIDFGNFTCEQVKLGESLKNTMPFSQLLKEFEELQDEASGIEIGLKKYNLDSIVLDMEKSNAKFFKSGVPISLTNRSTIANIKSIFGSPYWVDEDFGEVILFYEFEKGQIELQFEFPKKKPLSYITFMCDGILSKEEQRKSYGVTKPWPPGNLIK